MTKEKTEKTAEKTAEKTDLNAEERREVADALKAVAARSGGKSFIRRCAGIFFGTIYVLTLFVGGFVFGIIAAFFLPFFLPFSYLKNVGKTDPLAGILD